MSTALRTEKPVSERKFFVEADRGFTGSLSAVFRKNGIAELQDFYLIEGAEDCGLRHKLLRRAINYCDSKKTRMVYARIFPDLKGFFKRHGFSIRGRLKNPLNDRDDTLLVAKVLRSDD